MKILTNVKITNVTEDRITRECIIETNHPLLPSFEATGMAHNALVDDFFEDNLKPSYSIMLDEGSVDGITPSGSQYESEWIQTFKTADIISA